MEDREFRNATQSGRCPVRSGGVHTSIIERAASDMIDGEEDVWRLLRAGPAWGAVSSTTRLPGTPPPPLLSLHPGCPRAPALTVQGHQGIAFRKPGHPGIQDGGDSRMRGCGEEGFLCVFGMLAFPAMGPPTAQQLLASPCHRRRQTTRDPTNCRGREQGQQQGGQDQGGPRCQRRTMVD